MNQLNVVAGILLAYLSNYLIAQAVGGESAWRWMLGVVAVPSVLFFALLFFIPESPRWLVSKGRVDEARRVLEQVGAADVSRELQEIQASLVQAPGGGEAQLFQPKYRRPILLAWIVAMLNQLSGINALMYYAPRIFQQAGAAADDALLQAIAVGGTNLVFTIIALFIIDRAGRRPLLLMGGLGAALSLALTAWGFRLGEPAAADMASATAGAPPLAGTLVLVGLLGFIACHAIGQGAVIWVFLGEIFPNRVRDKGLALGSFTHWFMAAVVSWTFPLVAKASGWVAFAIFALFMLLQALFAWRMMPETRGVSLEELEQRLTG